MKGWKWTLPASTLLAFYGLALAAPFLAPYPPHQQFREYAYSPPTRLHWVDRAGHFRWRPFVYRLGRDPQTIAYQESDVRLEVRFFSRGAHDGRIHLFAADAGQPVFLLGSDSLGRDIFSRLAFGARFSLTIGLVGIGITLVIGVALGTAAGYLGSWWDRFIMRLTDVFLSLPGLFLVLGVRAVFPLDLSAWNIYWLTAVIFGLMGWGMVARVVRGQVMTLKSREHVLAARASGASHLRVILFHILPLTRDTLVVQSTVLVPLFIMAEVTLSFLGVGVQEPDVSWGNLLTDAASVAAIGRFPWLLTPIAFVFATVLAFNWLAEVLKGARGTERAWL